VPVATRADIAKLAGVSESTVSYVISGKRPISEPTRMRVLAAIQEVGYKSNYAAAALAGGSPRMVTMMISSLFTTPSSRINGALVDGIVDGVRESGFHSVIWPVSNDDDADVDLLIRSNFSGGVILMNVKENDQRVHLLNREKVPFVVLGRTEVGFKYNYVDRDFQAVDKIALTKLKDLGHIRIGVLMSGSSIPAHLRQEASDLKLQLQPLNVPNTVEGGAELAFTLKRDFPSITGIISLVDAASIGFMNASKEAGISIPKDLSIIGVNMLESQAISTKPAISTVAFDAYEMAKSCGKIMVETIEAGKNSKKKKIGELWIGDFMDRNSTSRASEGK
jgi:DNA-binding LacI/PurR family transcriptional regulator